MALPTFNRQYQSVKAPGQVAQPNMAKIFADMSANMNRQYQDRLKAKKDAESEDNKKLRDDLDYAQNFYTTRSNQVRQNLKTLGVNNPTTYQTADAYLNQITDYQLAAKKSNTRDEQRSILAEQAQKESELSEYISMIELGKASDKDFMDNYADSFNNIGQQGGAALTGEDNSLMRRYVSVMQARQGIGDNITEEMYYAPGEDGKPGSWMVHYNSDRIRQEYGEEGIHAPAAQIFGFTPETSPETDSDIRNSLKDKKIFKSDGSVTDNYLVLDDMGEVTLESGLIQQQTPIDKTRLMSDIAASVTPIAQGNLKSGNLANIDWTQEIRPWLVTQIKDGKIDANAKLAGTDKTYGQLVDYDLQVGDSNIGGSKWTMESQGVYESLFRDYAYDLVGPKQDYIAGSTRRQSRTEEIEVDASSKANQIFEDISSDPVSYFKNKKHGGKEILDVSIGTPSVGFGEEGLRLDLTYKVGTVRGDTTTNTMTYNLADPERARAFVEALDVDDNTKKEIFKLVETRGFPKIENFLPGISTGNLPIKK